MSIAREIYENYQGLTLNTLMMIQVEARKKMATISVNEQFHEIIYIFSDYTMLKVNSLYNTLEVIERGFKRYATVKYDQPSFE